MAKVMVLFSASHDALELSASAIEALAALGVTTVALLRDGPTAGVVLDGWAFDPARAAEAAHAVAGAAAGTRTLVSVMEMAIAASPTGGRRSWTVTHSAP